MTSLITSNSPKYSLEQYETISERPLTSISPQPIFAFIGGPGSGKTSLLNKIQEIASDSFLVIQEAAADLILQAKEEGIDNPFDDPDFEKQIFEEKIRREESGKSEAQTTRFARHPLVDRGLLDNLVYLKRFGKKDTPLYSYIYEQATTLGAFAGRYKAIFVVTPWNDTFDNDECAYRYESPAECREIHEAIIDIYKSSQSLMIEVPKGTIQERAEWVISYIRSS